MAYHSFCSTEIIFTNKEGLEETLSSLSSVHTLLVMSASSARRWNMLHVIDRVIKESEATGRSLTWIQDIDHNPTQASILKSLQTIGNKPIDIIVAIGGGSAIDLAKGISAFYSSSRTKPLTIEAITTSIMNKEYTQGKFIDILAVPSTAGTGSEVTQWATIWDVNKAGKMSIDTPGLKPKRAMIVPELTVTVPLLMTLSTGLDAMSQAVEAYWSKHTTPIVQELAYRAIEIIVQNLKATLDNPNDRAYREKLCRASVLAGIAFSHTRTTACHSISYPLTMLYGVPHGLAVALTLDAVASYNKGHFPNDNELYSIFRNDGGIKAWIDAVSDGITPMRLSAFGIGEADLPHIVNNAFTGGRMDNNPVDLDKDDVLAILKSVM